MLGNRLTIRLIQLVWGHGSKALGPMRLIRRSCLEALALRDRGFGWTLEMQGRAVEYGFNPYEWWGQING